MADCPIHPGTKVVRNGRRAGGHRQSFRCYPAAGGSHDFIEPLTTDLIGTCFTCQRDWDGGFPVARHAIYSVPVIADFLRNLGRGYSLRMAAFAARQDRLDEQKLRSARTGGRGQLQTLPTEDCRASADWILRYGSLICQRLLPRRWPSVIVVDAQPFQAKSTYPAKHPKAGQPKPMGDPAFAVLAAAARLPSSRSQRKHQLRVIHVRAMPADHKGDWADFFRSLPGRPRVIISDPDPQIAYAIKAVWPPGQRPRHLLSTWHYQNKVRQKFVKARWYPTTHRLAKEAESAFTDLPRFRGWRAKAERRGPAPVQAWLRRKGDEVELRLQAGPPTSTGDLEGFLTKVEHTLRIGRGRVSNLVRLDVRLGLLALTANRQDRRSTYEGILRAAIPTPISRPRLHRRSLDGEFYDRAWLLA